MNAFRARMAVVMSFAFLTEFASTSDTTASPHLPQIALVQSINLQGSFVSPQSAYADGERIFLCSFQGDLFVLDRDRRENFQLLQTVSIGAPLTAVRGDKDNLYVSSFNGNLYVFDKAWPIRLIRSIPLSSYGLSTVAVAGKDIYVAKGQASMTASGKNLFVCPLNPGDFAVEVGSSRSFGETEFSAGTTLVFDRTLRQPLIGSLQNPGGLHMNINAWEGFVYLTVPGCCGPGIYVFDAQSLNQVQFLNRTTNTVAGTRRKGASLLVGGAETGDIDLYALDKAGYTLTSSVRLRELTGFNGVEDIEIRALWADDIDNLVFAASSWGNDVSRGPQLPSFFVLEIRSQFTTMKEGRVKENSTNE